MFSYCTAGIPTFRVLSPLMVYSVFLYIWLLVVAYFNTRDFLFVLMGKNDDFLRHTFKALMMLAIVVSCCVPVLLWLDCPKYVEYLNSWAEFQVTYIETLNTKLSPNCHLLALLGAQYILHISMIRVKLNVYYSEVSEL